MITGTVVLAGAITLFRGQNTQVQLALVARDGHRTPVGFLPGNTFAPRIAPDGKRLAYDTSDGTVWIAELSNLASPRRISSVRNDQYTLWSADGEQRIAVARVTAGTWTQQGGPPTSLKLIRATPATAWTIREPTPPPKLTPADADPVFVVATIKPSKSAIQSKMFLTAGRDVITLNTSVSDLIADAATAIFTFEPSRVIALAAMPALGT